jgi:hypothetical protein
LDGLLPAFDENTKPSAISFCADVICAMAAFGRRHEASVIAALDGRESAGIGRHEARPSTTRVELLRGPARRPAARHRTRG